MYKFRVQVRTQDQQYRRALADSVRVAGIGDQRGTFNSDGNARLLPIRTYRGFDWFGIRSLTFGFLRLLRCEG